MRNQSLRSLLLIGSLACMAGGCDKAPTTGPTPPGGGQNFVLDYNVFTSTIEPILSAYGCDNVACHGGGIRGTFELSPNGNKNFAFDFEQARMQVDGNNPPMSLLAAKPLAPECGGPGHAGGYVFYRLDHPDYVAILEWIEAGEWE